MSGRKHNLLKYQTITSGNMASATLTSAVTNIQFLDNIALQFNWSGSPVGTFSIQYSVDYAQDGQGVVTNTGNWSTAVTLTLAGTSPMFVDITQTASPWIRVVYTKTSGTGTLNTFISGKMV